jgi:hypothetical protein
LFVAAEALSLLASKISLTLEGDTSVNLKMGVTQLRNCWGSFNPLHAMAAASMVSCCWAKLHPDEFNKHRSSLNPSLMVDATINCVAVATALAACA